MTRNRLTLALAGLLAIALGTPAAAQTSCNTAPSCSINNTASVTVPVVLKLTLSSATTSLTAPTVADYEAGFVNDAGPTATVEANRSWTLSVKSDPAVWTLSSGGANIAKAAGDLQWSVTGGAPFTLLTLLNVPAAAGTAGGSGAPGHSVSFTYHTLWSFLTDTPGTYTLTIVYTLSAP